MSLKIRQARPVRRRQWRGASDGSDNQHAVGQIRTQMTGESRKNAATEFVAALGEFLVQEAATGRTLEESLAKAHWLLTVAHNRLIAERRASFKVVPKP